MRLIAAGVFGTLVAACVVAPVGVSGNAPALTAVQANFAIGVGEEKDLLPFVRVIGTGAVPFIPLQWEVSNPSLLYIDPSNGRAKGLAAGTAVVKVTAPGNEAGATQLFIEVVGEGSPIVRAINVKPANHHMVVGDDVRLSAEVVLPDGQVNGNVAWSSSDDTIARVNPTTGGVSALKPGRVTIVAAYAAYPAFKSLAEIFVYATRAEIPPSPTPAPSLAPSTTSRPVEPSGAEAPSVPLSPERDTQINGATPSTPMPDPARAPEPISAAPLSTPTPTISVAPASPSPALPIIPSRSLEEWRIYRDPARVLVPQGANLTALHFQHARRGWFAGNNRILLYNRTGVEEPVLVARDNGIPSTTIIHGIHFLNDITGFAVGSGGRVYRTTDAGLNWMDISPPNASNSFQALAIAGTRIITVGDTQGNVWRANDGLSSTVAWELVPTFPSGRPADHPKNIVAGASFRGNTSLAYFVGDGVYRLDVDAPNGEERWKRILALQPLTSTGVTDAEGRVDYGDGQALQIRAASQNEMWVTTQGGSIYRLRSADTTTVSATRFPPGRYRNREANSPSAVFLPNPTFGIPALAVVDSNTIFLGHAGVYDSRDGGHSWRNNSGVPVRITALDMAYSTEPDEAGRLRGWALGTNGEVYQFRIFPSR